MMHVISFGVGALVGAVIVAMCTVKPYEKGYEDGLNNLYGEKY
ncbi:Uncharacterised protein [Niallia circulans]|jgi:hypothetical protein|nr:hypothetical protein [Niallia circulans]MED3839728.1 hypothetical protein [Niallia circulans]MED4241213.1 hypothetical protein [Niallia circulans]MED4247874.1 hypothetical protein [Niallia circulans]SPU10983.1 Uncharacterised protein [Niallia circulans]